MPCEGLKDEVVGLWAGVQAEQDLLDSASPTQRAAIIRRILQLTKKAIKKEEEYDKCLCQNGLNGFECTFRGEATITTTNSHSPGPDRKPVELRISVGEYRRGIAIVSMTPLVTQVRSTPVGNNQTTITLRGGILFSGILDKDTGRISASVLLDVHHSNGLIGDSTLSIAFDTFATGGSPLNASTGDVTFAGTGRFEGGYLDDDQATIVLAGKLDPIP